MHRWAILQRLYLDGFEWNEIFKSIENVIKSFNKDSDFWIYAWGCYQIFWTIEYVT